MHKFTTPHLKCSVCELKEEENRTPRFIDKPISSITRGPRQSNIELLRIVAMLLVLVVHADYLSLGRPSSAEMAAFPLPSLCRVFFQSLAIICVNVFVLISGWFQIRPSVKGGVNFLFQCLYMSVIVMVGCFLFGIIKFENTKDLLKLLSQEIFFNYGGFWFIKAYLVLYILSPILNTFLRHAGKRTVLVTLICFYVLQSVWSPLHHFKTGFYDAGYSPLSFMGLYLLANTVRRYYSDYKMKQACYFFFVPLILMVIITSLSYYENVNVPYDMFAYSNPLVVCESLGLLMIFACIRIKTNKMINWVSASAFGVYLFHINPLVLPVYLKLIKDIYSNTHSLVTLLSIAGVILGVFILSILLDQPRKALWRYICRKISFRPILSKNF